MKKYIFPILLVLLCVSVQAKTSEPKYKITANSNSQSDIQEMYDVKASLLKDYKVWAEGVTNKDQVLADHQKEYNAVYYQGVYTVQLGSGEGKSLEGELKVNYCESSTEIQKKSFLLSWLFG